MKKNFFYYSSLLFLMLPVLLSAQGIEFPKMDKSPMDAAHYPDESSYVNYLKEDNPNRNAKIKVIYGRPYKKGRKVFGELEKFGTDWRLGANECTEVQFFQNVEIGGVTVPRGIYSIFAELQADHWVMKISTERFIGGSKNRDVSKDVVATKVMTTKTNAEVEQFTIGFQKINDGMVHMICEWDNTRAALPINLHAAIMDGEDKSPMDYAYFPHRSRLQNYLKPEEVEANKPQMRVLYSRPQMKGRKVFGELLKYGEMWRLGANQTTLITFYENVNIGGVDIRKGTYGLFAMVNDGNWEFIVHKSTNSWGNHKHDEKDNIVTVKAMTEKTPSTLEALSVTYEDKGNNTIDVIFGWENTMARLPVTVKKK